jgi:hypothetical protein
VSHLHLHKIGSSAGICPVTAALSDNLASQMQPLATLAADSACRVFQRCLFLLDYASFVCGTAVAGPRGMME